MNNPFRYSPKEDIIQQAQDLIEKISKDKFLYNLFREGKMMGILIAEDNNARKHPLYAFSGNVQGRNDIEGFVPPIYDLLDPEGYFKKEEAEISAIDKHLKAMEQSYRLKKAISDLAEIEKECSQEEEKTRSLFLSHKKEREVKRRSFSSLSPVERDEQERLLIRESQFEKAELKRLKRANEQKIASVRSAVDSINQVIEEGRKETRRRSDALQKWIFEQFIVHNALGEEKSILDIFKDQGLVPPGGTGECAGPKLLEYAFRNNLKPVSIGEFWFGDGSTESGHIQGRFYPCCQAKCGPLLKFMLKGLPLENISQDFSWEILYEDDCILVANKPSGMLSVPGKASQISLIKDIEDKFGITLYPVHRLDMDTSGIIVFAKTETSQESLQRQFEQRRIHKRYWARLDSGEKELKKGDKGTVSLPLSSDYLSRPRQIVDFKNGKEAISDYEVIENNPDGTIDIIFSPKTGRTHQLRVHSSHPDGLGHSICGDRLYGSMTEGNLQLCAFEITLSHPESAKEMTFRIEAYPKNTFAAAKTCKK